MSDQETEKEPVVEETVQSETPDINPLAVELAAARAEIEAVKAERDELKDQMLRKVADFDNYRKRVMKEKEEARQFANSALLEDLCQVLDDFERAIRSSEAASDFTAFHSGIVMIEGQFASMLERKYNLKRVEALGKVFNPEHHEAVAMIAAEDGKDLTIVEEYQRGYLLHDRVLRTSKVKVGPGTTNEETKEGE